MSNTPVLQAIGLTLQQQNFIEGIINGLSNESAAVAAGYPETKGALLLRSDWARLGLQTSVANMLRVDGAVIGYRILKKLTLDEAVSPGVRAKCAIALLDRAGFVAPKADTQKPAEKELTEMSQSELLEVINKAETVLSARAKDVSAPDLGTSSTQTIDIFE